MFFGESGPEKSVCGRRHERRRRNEAKCGRGREEERGEEAAAEQLFKATKD